MICELCGKPIISSQWTRWTKTGVAHSICADDEVLLLLVEVKNDI